MGKGNVLFDKGTELFCSSSVASKIQALSQFRTQGGHLEIFRIIVDDLYILKALLFQMFTQRVALKNRAEIGDCMYGNNFNFHELPLPDSFKSLLQ